MGKDVYANGNAVSCKAGDGKVIAAFPDVCNSPPPPPAGPIPIPYPDTSMSSDLKEGSSSVKIGGQPVALKGQSYFGTSPLGNEAATKTFGGSLITHTITGETHFQAGSMDVKIEGANACRHLDLTTSNHAGDPGATPPFPEAEKRLVTGGAAVDDPTKCPCCKGPLHENQKDPVTKDPYPRMKESDFYDAIGTYFVDKAAEMAAQVASGALKFWATKAAIDPNPAYNGRLVHEVIVAKGEAFKKDMARLTELRKNNPGCLNVHTPPDEGCGVHFKNTGGKAAEVKKMEFKDSVRNRVVNEWQAKGHKVPSNGAQINHKTPVDAGGCPIGSGNLVPDCVLTGECAEIETLQTRFQNALSNPTQRVEILK